MLIHLTNDFHLTRTRLRAELGQPLTVGQVSRARKALCGVPGCKCSESSLGTRGYQGYLIEDDGEAVTIYSEGHDDNGL